MPWPSDIPKGITPVFDIFSLLFVKIISVNVAEDNVTRVGSLISCSSWYREHRTETAEYVFLKEFLYNLRSRRLLRSIPWAHIF